MLCLGALPSFAQLADYVGAKQCAACHPQLHAEWQHTAMGRSFYAAEPGETVDDFYCQASDTHYSMSLRDGKSYQRRWQIGFDGKPTNVEEMRVDYVMGSGKHARTYLSRTSQGTLLELPLGWYSEKGGHWGMSPGYDAVHPPSHRVIAYDCMFCHNAYPQIPPTHAEEGSEPIYAGTLPEGIDCQRCHGPGAKHVQTVLSGRSKEQIRASIVNPKRLSNDRQLEVCMQCHLLTTSSRLPGLVRRFGKTPFSYVAGQPLGNFQISLDHAPGTGYDDKFEIAGGAYRLRQSQCYLKSEGKLTCETCHNPHAMPSAADAPAYYARICRQCHAGSLDRLTASGAHSANPDCVSCHMPKRRTDDVVNVVMTDHRIQRGPPDRNLLADKTELHLPKAEEYHGEVVPYYPSPLPAGQDSSLYLALAQVHDGRNLINGIAQLTESLLHAVSPDPGFYMALGDAWHSAGDPAKSVLAYRQALNRWPNSARAARYVGISLRESGKPIEAAAALHRALKLAPSDAQSWFELGLAAADQGRMEEAFAAVQKANALDSDLPDVWNTLGVYLTARGASAEAEDAFRHALRIDPYDPTAHSNFARLLNSRGDLPQALYHLEKAVRLQPSGAVNRYEYALTLVKMDRFEDSQREVQAAVEADPNLAEAHELLGGLLSRKSDFDAALVQYREAVRLKPDFSRAQFDLATTLAMKGDLTAAAIHYRAAENGTDPKIAALAARALQRIGASQ